MAIVGTLPVYLVNGTVADATQVMADLLFIVQQVNANAQPLGQLVQPASRDVNIPSDSAIILPTDANIFVFNTSGSPVSFTPPVTPGVDQVVTVVDAGLTAGVNHISFTGTISGQVNPTLISVAGFYRQFQFRNGNVYFIG